MLFLSVQTSNRERIDALELLGATFVDKKRDLLGALKYWKRAMDLRYTDSNNVVHKPEPKQLIMAYDYAREVSICLSLLVFSSSFGDYCIALNACETLLCPFYCTEMGIKNHILPYAYLHLSKKLVQLSGVFRRQHYLPLKTLDFIACERKH